MAEQSTPSPLFLDHPAFRREGRRKQELLNKKTAAIFADFCFAALKPERQDNHACSDFYYISEKDISTWKRSAPNELSVVVVVVFNEVGIINVYIID